MNPTDFDITDYADMGEFEDTILDDILKRQAERRDYALRGAWMADYRYVHVFERPLGHVGLDEGPPLWRAALPVFMPAYEPEHPTEYADRTYSYTYDLQSIPDHVIKEAIDGNIDTSCL